MSESICNWGILSTANIAMKNWHSIALSGNGRVVAVGSRESARAQTFIDACQSSVPVTHRVDAVEGYENLLARDDIDAVYLPLPTALRTEWVIKAANAGKHVMVEKPCGVTAADVQRIIDACSANKVQFMDGVMFMHSARLPAMRAVLNDGISIGPVRRITSHFSFHAEDDFFTSNIRGSVGLEPAGCLGDLGWYTIRFSQWVMNFEMPVEVRGRILQGVPRNDSTEIVPVEFQGEMHYASGVSSTFFNSFCAHNQQLAIVCGALGDLQLNDYVLPFYDRELSFEVSNHSFEMDACRFNMARRTRRFSVNEYANNAADAQETNLFRNFAALVNSGQRDDHWPRITLQTQQILDAVLTSAQNGSEPVPLQDTAAI
ncbi:MAG: Gfo/Idh/MocA family oxidoreductase [Fuerstiella sp.]|nr:Gfo/Idh/MocA family oxidoreductase [Fuerstiella sp.]